MDLGTTGRGMDIMHLDHSQGLVSRLLALDRLLGSMPLHQRQNLDLARVSEDINTRTLWDVEELYRTVDTVPRPDRIPAILVDICRLSWQGRIYCNVYRHSDIDQSRDPTCSEVLQLLPKLDILLETSLHDKIKAVVSSAPPFRFLDLPTELQLHVYAQILPRQPYLTLLNVAPRRHASPRYDLAALRTCRKMHNELVEHFYKDQVIVMNVYDPRDCAWAFKKNSPRDRLIAQKMRIETRSYFKKIEIRVLDMEEPNTDRKGPYWEANQTDIWDSDGYFTETLETFPNLKTATVSFEIGENKIRYWSGWYNALGYVAEFLIESIPKHIQIQWDFQPTSDPDLQELAGEEEDMMYDLKKVVAKETIKKGGTVKLGTRLIMERIITPARL